MLNNRISVVLPQWTPNPALALDPAYLETVLQHVHAIHLLLQQPPIKGEVYATHLQAYEQLLNYSFCAGFQVVTTSGGEGKGRVRYTCIQGGISFTVNYVQPTNTNGATGKPPNTRKLQPEDCKRKTTTKKVGCP
jgi:hypothetical protein